MRIHNHGTFCISSDMDERMSWIKSNDTGVVGLTRDSR